MVLGRQAFSYWGPAYFQGRTVKLSKAMDRAMTAKLVSNLGDCLLKKWGFHSVFLGASHENAVVFDKNSWNNHENMPKYHFLLIFTKILKNKFNAMSTSYPFIWLQDSYPQLLHAFSGPLPAPNCAWQSHQTLAGPVVLAWFVTVTRNTNLHICCWFTRQNKVGAHLVRVCNACSTSFHEVSTPFHRAFLQTWPKNRI